MHTVIIGTAYAKHEERYLLKRIITRFNQKMNKSVTECKTQAHSIDARNGGIEIGSKRGVMSGSEHKLRHQVAPVTLPLSLSLRSLELRAWQNRYTLPNERGPQSKKKLQYLNSSACVAEITGFRNRMTSGDSRGYMAQRAVQNDDFPARKISICRNTRPKLKRAAFFLYRQQFILFR